MNYRTPGVYIEEISKLPPSIAQVETAIPAFIGYTERAADARGLPLLNEPKRITSLLEYETFFGAAQAETSITVSINESPGRPIQVNAEIGVGRSPYLMYYSMQMYFANGGGSCWIVSVGNYSTTTVGFAELKAGLDTIEKIDEISLIVFPEAQNLSTSSDYYTLYGEAMDLCEKMQDRFTVMDVWRDPALPLLDWRTNIETLRNATTSEINTLKYGAAYFPNVETILDYYYGGEGSGDSNVQIVHTGGDGSYNGTLAELRTKNNAHYFTARSRIRDIPMELPPSPGVVGIYANIDSQRGVWKAPANVNMDFVIRPVIKITDEEQRDLNVDTNFGKSVNAIRSFTGRGPSIVWGSRTLAGNDNEWRYIPVRRYFNMVQESVKKATIQFVFEPNDANTWTRVKSMIENFLSLQWRAGALMGASTEEAYFVKVGINETMTELDIWEGRMIVEIGMAVVRPAEFIILKFSHKMLSES